MSVRAFRYWVFAKSKISWLCNFLTNSSRHINAWGKSFIILSWQIKWIQRLHLQILLMTFQYQRASLIQFISWWLRQKHVSRKYGFDVCCHVTITCRMARARCLLFVVCSCCSINCLCSPEPWHMLGYHIFLTSWVKESHDQLLIYYMFVLFFYDNPKKVPRACQSCRQRKTKCSGDTPVCRQCICPCSGFWADIGDRQLEELSSKTSEYENLLKDIGNYVDGRTAVDSLSLFPWADDLRLRFPDIRAPGIPQKPAGASSHSLPPALDL